MAEREKEISIPIGKETINGTLAEIKGARGLVIFVHGSGSSRKSPRNRFVADELQKGGFTTLLFDLLTPEEERIDDVSAELRFDIPLLAERSIQVISWTQKEVGLKVGLFGASTGAAAALVAASKEKGRIGAVVSRGGRPDLALEHLAEVIAPTLFIVGGEDRPVIEMNREAYEKLGGKKKMIIVDGATHLFEEFGKLEEVARHTTAWFQSYLT